MINCLKALKNTNNYLESVSSVETAIELKLYQVVQQ